MFSLLLPADTILAKLRIKASLVHHASVTGVEGYFYNEDQTLTLSE